MSGRVAPADVVRRGLGSSYRAYPAVPTLRVSPRMVAVHVPSRSQLPLPVGGPRGMVTGVSRASLARMMRTIATLDFEPWEAAVVRGWTVPMVTLTYPGDWLRWAPSAQVCAGHLAAWWRRVRRATGYPVSAIWVREWQRRGAPHYHVLVPLPARVGDIWIADWVSRSWFEVVGSGDSRHLAAGTNVSWSHG
jgi:hypothetical protein